MSLTPVCLISTSCQLRVMAIGGGGWANWGGGGSGYIQYLSKTITSSSQTMIQLSVGNKKVESYVTIDGDKISALPGTDGENPDGGNGYCGGGGSGSPCGGGTNGTDGECSSGGFGTGEDISTYFFDNFKLTPGKGGLAYEDNSYYRGGGGGGVLINEDGPGVRDNGTSVQSKGEGFGGGGFNSVWGEPEVVIIEIVEV